MMCQSTVQQFERQKAEHGCDSRWVDDASHPSIAVPCVRAVIPDGRSVVDHNGKGL